MGFLNGNDSDKPKALSVYLEVTEQPKTVRPLKDKPQSVWGHTIPEVTSVGPDGKPVTLRRYAFEICTSTSRSGAGCQGCTTQDPLWHLLDKKTQTNKKGQRVDFPKKCVHLLPVVETATNGVRLMKGGNQTYEAMDAWHTAQPDGQKDLRRCDWNIYKTGQKKMTKYHVIRNDATPFVPSPEQLAEAQSVISKGLQDMSPAAPDKFLSMINGEGQNTATNTQEVSEAVAQVDQVQARLLQMAEQASVPVQQPPPPKPQPVAQQTVPATSVLSEFTAWLTQQPEFQGAGIIENLVPVLKEHIGGINYHGCSPEQLNTLKTVLSSKLESIRAKRA